MPSRPPFLVQSLTSTGLFLGGQVKVPVVFVGSSKETSPVAEAIRDALKKAEIDAVVWTDGVFGASHFPIDDLESLLQESDFVILVAGLDDYVMSRGAGTDAPRDNVVFELGLFMGALGRQRSFLVVPKGAEIKIPTDLLGLTLLHWDPNVETADGAVADTCQKVLESISNAGPI